MDCQEFEAQHVAFVDDVLCAEEMAAMRRHAEACPRCARRDTMVRRGLLLARNMPTIEPSADFMERLNARLHELDAVSSSAVVPRASHAGAFVLLAASVLVVAGLGLMMHAADRTPTVIRMAPVVASLPEPAPSPLPAPVYMATMAAGIPVWPAALLADEAPMHLARMELREAVDRR